MNVQEVSTIFNNPETIWSLKLYQKISTEDSETINWKDVAPSDRDEFIGIKTQVELINHLRQPDNMARINDKKATGSSKKVYQLKTLVAIANALGVKVGQSKSKKEYVDKIVATLKKTF